MAQQGSSTLQQFTLPDLGEGLTEAVLLRWLVNVGDVIELNQPLVEVETAKAVVEIPSPFSGLVHELICPAGSTVAVGSPIVCVDGSPHASDALEVTKSAKNAVLVGYGVDNNEQIATSSRRRRHKIAISTVPAVAPSAASRTQSRVKATPPVRKMAKDLGIDLLGIDPTGPHGSITRDDLLKQSQPVHSYTAQHSENHERIPVTGVRKLTAEAMVASAFTAPHVTEFLTIDATATVEVVTWLRQHRDYEGIKVTPMLCAARAVVMAAQRHPLINSSWDEEAGQIIVKKNINLGIAAATPRGLLVPNIKQAQHLTLRELAQELNDLVTVAKQDRTTHAQLQGGTITITNVGVFGIDSGTPIIPPGEAAIVAVGAINQRPWVHEGSVVPRWICTLALSFDHRIIDGELGSRFLADVGHFMSDPAKASLAWG